MTAASRRLPHEPEAERLAWLVTIGVVALSVLALVGPLVVGDDESDVSTTESAATTSGATRQSGEPAADGDVAVAVGAEQTVDESFTISASGDILIHRRVAEAAAVGDSYDFSELLAPVRGLIATRDFAICHLENPLSATNNDLAFGESADGGAFRSPNQIADAIAEIGFDSCSTASNHSYDSGESSVLNTVAQFERVGLPHVGMATSAEQAAFLWQFDVKGTIVGHLSYAYGLNGREPGTVPTDRVAQIDETTILADAARHRAAGSEFIVVSLHWGDEFVTELSEQQADLGPRLLASPDIDLIIGHHAHVPQRIDEIDGEYIAYGLGNLLSNQSSSAPECPTKCPLESQDGVLADFVVDRLDDGTLGVVDVVVNPTWVDNGATWKVIDTQAPPTLGVAVDTVVLGESAERTWSTMGIGRP